MASRFTDARVPGSGMWNLFDEQYTRQFGSAAVCGSLQNVLIVVVLVISGRLRSGPLRVDRSGPAAAPVA